MVKLCEAGLPVFLTQITTEKLKNACAAEVFLAAATLLDFMGSTQSKKKGVQTSHDELC